MDCLYRHNKLRDDVAFRLSRSSRYDFVLVEFPLYVSHQLVYVADVVGGYDLGSGVSRLVGYEIKTGFSSKTRTKMLQQRDNWFRGVDADSSLLSDTFITVTWLYGVERHFRNGSSREKNKTAQNRF